MQLEDTQNSVPPVAVRQSVRLAAVEATVEVKMESGSRPSCWKVMGTVG